MVYVDNSFWLAGNVGSRPRVEAVTLNASSFTETRHRLSVTLICDTKLADNAFSWISCLSCGRMLPTLR